jgi:hypothetical protein
MSISKKAAKEIIALKSSKSFRKDMCFLKKNKYTRFIKDGKMDVDAYLEFCDSFNAMVGNNTKKIKTFEGKNWKL